MLYVKESQDGFNWMVKVAFRVPIGEILSIEYKYIILTSCFEANDPRQGNDVRFEKDAQISWEVGPNKKLKLEGNEKRSYTVTTSDLFQDSIDTLESIFYKKPFRDIVYFHSFDPQSCLIKSSLSGNVVVHFRIMALQVPKQFMLYITGSSQFFGNWTRFEPLRPIDELYWEFSFEIPSSIPMFEYKYLMIDPSNHNIYWEHRPNRFFRFPQNNTQIYLIHDWLFKQPANRFHGAGITISLYSIHSHQSFMGIGELYDLKLLIDWAVLANMSLIQLLPIMDIFYSNTDHLSHSNIPISAFAINPLYLTLRNIGGYEGIRSINRGDPVSVRKIKMDCLKSIFSKQDINQLRSDPMFIKYINDNQYWIHSYSMWCAIRDECLENGKDVEWPVFNAQMNSCVLDSNDSSLTIGCLFNAWVQYQCHIQLMEISSYAKENGIVLSCIMTIGQRKNSADIWTHPEFFDLNNTIGAPPDIFSFHGQNWGYPSWNWEEMKKDGYQWLREQMSFRERYFQACQFDHPLGFFRCWAIPTDTENPLFGHFVPSNPIDIKDLQDLQIRDIARLCRPLFPISDVLSFALPEPVKEKIINLLAVCEGGIWKFRSKYTTDTSIKEVIKQLTEGLDEVQKLQYNLAEKILLSHFESVCLIPDREQPHKKYYPRFSMTDSTVFRSLPERDAQVLYKLFVDFYYRINLQLWHEQGQHKLSVLASSSMQFFGYDLGASLNDEEKILHRVGICSYRVQRVPRESIQRFDGTNNFPYMSVCSPTPHDLPHLTLWWRQEQADAQLFYHQFLKKGDVAPLILTPDIASGIIQLHLSSDSMWCMFVFDDLLSIESEFDSVISNLWINDPSCDNKFRYRMKLSLNDLLAHKEWIKNLSKLIENSHRGRNAEYGFIKN